MPLFLFALFCQVGYDLTAGLPGHSGIVTVTALGGERNISVLSLQSGMLKAGLFIELDGEAYEIEAVDASNETISLVEVCVCSWFSCTVLLAVFLDSCGRQEFLLGVLMTSVQPVAQALGR